jgi:putative chitinase
MTITANKTGAKVIQTLLKQSVAPSILVDGDFGNNSVKALIEYQKVNKLATTGKCTDATFASLLASPVDKLTVVGFNTVMMLGTPEANLWFNAIKEHAVKNGINTLGRLAAFLATITVESGHLKKLVENLNYSAEGLAKTWPNRFAEGGKRGGLPNAIAKQIARNPILIANHAYASRMGNGNVASGDGHKYRGRGPIGITGFDNYKICGDETGMNLIKNPELLEEPIGGIKAAVWFWTRNRLNVAADIGDFDGVSDLVNIGRKTTTYGDAIGYQERYEYYLKYLLAIVS